VPSEIEIMAAQIKNHQLGEFVGDNAEKIKI
jgi:hypothetical protein